MSKKIEKAFEQGSTVFVGKTDEDNLIVLLKTGEKDYLSFNLTTVKVAKLGITTYVAVPNKHGVQISVLKEVAQKVSDITGYKISNTLNVVNEEDMEDLEDKIVSDYNDTLASKGIIPMPSEETREALNAAGYTITYELKDPDMDTSAKVKTSDFDPKASHLTQEDEELLEYNDLGTKGIDYSDSNELVKTYDLVTKGLAKVVMFTGEAGTGKTTVFSRMCADAGAVPAIINASTNADEDYIFGALRDNPDYPKNPQTEPQFKWQDGIATRAIRNGHWLLIDEVNMIQNQGVIALLNDVLEYPHKLHVNGETIYAHENFRIFFAMNVGYNHTYELNQALANRVQRFVEFPEVTVDETIKRLDLKFGYTNTRAIKKLFDVYTKIKNLAIKYGSSSVISYRNMQACIEQATTTGDIRDSVNSTMLLSTFYEIIDDEAKASVNDVLKHDIKELEALFRGEAYTSDNGHFFSMLVNDTSDLDEEDEDLLETLDRL